jgi:hypothetical protein
MHKVTLDGSINLILIILNFCNDTCFIMVKVGKVIGVNETV